MPVIRYFVLMVVLIYSGCSTDNESKKNGGSAETSATEKLSDSLRSQRIDEVFRTGRRLGSDERGIRTRHGKPDETIYSDTTNRHTGDSDQVFRLIYPNMEFEIYRVHAEGKELLMETILRRDEARPFSLFQKFETRESTEKNLGTPGHTFNQEETTVLEYETLKGAPQFVLFFFEDNVLQKIQWDYYID